MRKTFLLNNEFDHVETPVADRGSLTIMEGNKRNGRNPSDVSDSSVANRRSTNALPSWEPKPFKAAPKEQLPPMFQDVLALKVMVSQPAFCYTHEVNSEERQTECQEHLKTTFKLLQAYEAKHGALPQAAFYPQKPKEDTNSLRVILGEKKDSVFLCPTCSPELQQFGLNYAWNQKVSGQKLSAIKEPAQTWLLIDFVSAHDWMVSNGYCGHKRGVNVLYADGSVKWIEGFSTEVSTKAKLPQWLQWAKE